MNKIYQGDCLETLKTLPDNSIDSVVTDPPYGLSFMGKKWDYDVPSVEIWKECLRVLKPGGYLLAFAGTRTQHRMAVRIEDAGFEIRDMIAWIYGSGFPKSLNIGKAVDKLQGNEREVVGEREVLDIRNGHGREYGSAMFAGEKTGKIIHQDTKGTSEWEGWGTSLKPSLEPITVARKPLSEKTVAENVLKWGTGGINIDGSRVEGKYETRDRDNSGGDSIFRTGKGGGAFIEATGRFPANLLHDGSDEVVELFPNDSQRFFYCAKASKGERNGRTNNYLIVNVCVENMGQEASQLRVMLEKTGSWFIELFGRQLMEKYQMDIKSTIKTETKKTTHCLILSCLPHLSIKESIADALKMKEKNGGSHAVNAENINEWKQIITKELTEFLLGVNPVVLKTQLKISVSENNFHSTVKPIALMTYLVKLVTKQGGLVLDPFTGSGSTGIACRDNGFNFIGCELDPEYCKIASARTGFETVNSELTLEEQDEIQEETTTLEEKLVKLGVQSCECGGKIVKLKNGRTCQDCFKDY